ncbi:MAG: right-handed parallel beta-helix repeat-containing protein [Acidobacteriota bacterium]|nr:right-handed parallel beta-helix repeat-containing protein [Acidobacteriota bacterium]
MKTRQSFSSNALTVALFILAFSTLATAQATRTWVSGVGDDVNPCSRTAPCKTFAGAISKTAAGGEINAIDPGGYGAVTITKSITIDGAGTHASILAAGTNGVIINAGANDVVTLRNLSINGAGTGFNGIRILNAKAVFIEDCVIFGFSGANPNGRGISDVRTTVGAGNLFIKDTIIRNNSQSHIVIIPGAGAIVNATIDNVRLERSASNTGLVVLNSSNVLIRNSVISGNSFAGIYAEENSGAVDINVENCAITHNGTGVTVAANSPVIRLSNTMITGNSTGLSGINIFSFGNNKIAGNNAGNGPPSGGVITQQ